MNSLPGSIGGGLLDECRVMLIWRHTQHKQKASFPIQTFTVASDKSDICYRMPEIHCYSLPTEDL